MLYLDTLASYPLLPEAREVLLNSCDMHYSNPSAGHDLGESAKEAIENARTLIADSIEALPSEIIFTSGATESNNLIFKGHILRLLQSGTKPHVITSLIEHKCILEICQYLESQGCEISYIKPNNEGSIDLEAIKKAIKPNTELISIMHVNNELGTVNDLKAIGKLCIEHGIRFHTDAAQGYLKLPINVDKMNLDYLSISAHKIGGPKGVGAVFVRDLRSSMLEPLIHGAGQEQGIRGGTLATPLIESFGAAVRYFPQQYNGTRFQNLKNHFVDALSESNIDFKVNGAGIVLPSCINITLLNIDVANLIRGTRSKYSFSQGSACSSGSIEASHVLAALSLNREQASRTLRLSFSESISNADLDKLVSDIEKFKVCVSD